MSKQVIAIEHPKVFISYAWGTKEYQAKVVSFAEELVSHGVNVLLDKWSLKEGNNTYAFMEQSVTDPDITNVLILLDSEYAKKADSRSGGVGTETQIISPEIYNKVKQEKFIPVVFERGVNGEIYKPTYLNGLLHFDLSIDEGFDDEYQRLVKRLYGVEVYKKPELGSKPSWLESTPKVSTKIRTAYSILKTGLPEQIRLEQFGSFLTKIKERIFEFGKDSDLKQLDSIEYISIYGKTKSIRDEFLELMEYCSFISNGECYVADMLEETQNIVNSESGLLKEIKFTLLHEIFIYMVAIYYKKRNYKALSYILGRTYFKDRYSGDCAENYNIFYYHNETMDSAVSERDNKKYYCGTAQYWIENINISACSKNLFVFADLLCYNYAVFGKEYHYDWYWFPKSYVYDGNQNSIMRVFAVKLQSLEYLTIATRIFGYNEVEEFKNKFAEIESKNSTENDFREYRYSSAFDVANILCHYIKASALGTRK